MKNKAPANFASTIMGLPTNLVNEPKNINDKCAMRL